MAVLLAHREAAWAAWAVSIVVRVCCVLAAVFACFFVATEPTWAATVNIGYSQRGATNALSAPFFGANTKRLKPHNILAQLDFGPDAPWLVVGTHAWTEIDSAPVGVAHRYEHYGVGMLNQPAGWVLQALNGSQPLPAGTHAVNVQVEIMTYEAIDLMASIDLGRWTPSLRGSFLEPLERTEKRIAGMATYRITPGFALRLGINYPPTAYQLGLVWETWRFAILAQPVATGPRSLGITLGRKIKF